MDAYDERRIHEACIQRLSDHMDGGLAPAERDEVERHLDACASCARVAAELSEVRERARRLEPVAPPRDLWPAIRARLDEPEVYRLPVTGVQEPGRRTFRFTAVQLAAASLALALATGAGGWALAALSTGADAAPIPPDDASVFTTATSPGASGLDSELEALQAALRDGSETLEPNTLRLLEKNLGVIERAIAEARAALEMDPGNAYLRDHLRSALERRRAYLEEAARLASWAD